MNSTVLPNISLKDELSSEEFENLSILPALAEKYDELRNSIRKKLSKIDKKFKNHVFFAKPVYKKENQKVEVQGMIHTGPKEIYETINKDIQSADIALYEGIMSEDPAKGLRFSDEKKKKNYRKFANQMEHLTLKDTDIQADISNELINRIMASKLSETEFELWVKEQEVGGKIRENIPSLVKHYIRKFLSGKMFSKKFITTRAQGVEEHIHPKETHEGVLSDTEIEKTAQLSIDELEPALKPIIAEHNAEVIKINQEKNKNKKLELFESFKTQRYLWFHKLKYLWIKSEDEESASKKLTWLDEQLMRFVNPDFNIEIAEDEVILEERNSVLAKAINTHEEIKNKQNIHANYGQAHLEGIHDLMLHENWNLKDIELTPVKYPKISFWKRTKDLIKAPFLAIKSIPKFLRMGSLKSKAKQENETEFKNIQAQLETAKNSPEKSDKVVKINTEEKTEKLEDAA